MDIVFLIGRILFGGFFLMMGLMHFMKYSKLKEYAGSKGVPMPGFATWFSGLMLLAGGVGVVFGIYTFVALILIGAFLFFSAVIMHRFWSETEEMDKMREMVNFKKNMALLGAALVMLAMVTVWPLSFQNEKTTVYYEVASDVEEVVEVIEEE